MAIVLKRYHEDCFYLLEVLCKSLEMLFKENKDLKLAFVRMIMVREVVHSKTSLILIGLFLPQGQGLGHLV